jgi:D-alanyl-D-alanine carboxypeptidase
MFFGPVVAWQRLAVAGLVAMFAIGALQEEAAARASSHKAAKSERHHRVIHGPNYRPPYAAIVIDDKSGQVLHAMNADEPRHPASLTKIMTLYLLFEHIEAGRLKLDSRLDVSNHAAVQNPTKLGLKPKGTITVEDAIKGIVTKSANDAAVVVAEAIGGTEAEFARLMTTKARMLGMTSTTYVNASGLPDLEQITTARDQAVLGRAIQHRFPVYYQYFATPSFRYRNIEMRNHNALLGNVKGVDGIKTGYTEASGYNLVTSCRRDDKHIVAVVLGGTSNAARDARMRQLIEEHLPQAAVQRTKPIVTELGGQQGGSGVPIAPELATSRSVPAEKVEGPSTAKAEPQGSSEQLSAKALASEEKPAPSRAKAHVRGSKRQSSKPRDNGKPAAQGAATPGYTFSIFAPASASPMYSRAVH